MGLQVFAICFFPQTTPDVLLAVVYEERSKSSLNLLITALSWLWEVWWLCEGVFWNLVKASSLKPFSGGMSMHCERWIRMGGVYFEKHHSSSNCCLFLAIQVWFDLVFYSVHQVFSKFASTGWKNWVYLKALSIDFVVLTQIHVARSVYCMYDSGNFD
jgi:hypothetical protein